MDELYLIWSNEYTAWWRPESRGYTSRVESAGRYTKEEALKICNGANYGWDSNNNPLELPIPESMATELINDLAGTS